MNIMFVNIRGIEEKYKIDWVCRPRREHKLFMIGIQETKFGESSPLSMSVTVGMIQTAFLSKYLPQEVLEGLYLYGIIECFQL